MPECEGEGENGRRLVLFCPLGINVGCVVALSAGRILRPLFTGLAVFACIQAVGFSPMLRSLGQRGRPGEHRTDRSHRSFQRSPGIVRDGVTTVRTIIPCVIVRRPAASFCRIAPCDFPVLYGIALHTRRLIAKV